MIGGVMRASFHVQIGEWEQTMEGGFPALWTWITDYLSLVLIQTGIIRNFWGLFVFVVIASLLAVIFIISPLQVGKARYYLNHAYYLHVVWVMLVRNMKIVLWCLCLVFPGIYKSYQYYMIPYLLAENSSLSCEQIFAISKQMTRQQKFDIFVLNLSFVGWYFLGALLFGVGQIFVDPYCSATDVELYLARRSVYGKESS